MRKSYKFQKRIRLEKNFLFNHMIRVPEVTVIDEEGAHLGVMSTSEALALAQDRGLDLVEVSPVANPPVAKIMNYSSFRYQKEKELKRQKKQNKTLDVKSIRLSMKIGEHDIATKAVQAEKFLAKGHKVKLELIIRGREFTHLDLAKKVLVDFRNKMTTPTILEQDTTKQGNKMFMILMPEKITPNSNKEEEEQSLQ